MRFPEKMKRDVWNRQRGLCNYCELGLTYNGGCEMDHAVPKSWGGKDIIENAQLLCGTCHGIKSFHESQIAGAAARQNMKTVTFGQKPFVTYYDSKSEEEPAEEQEAPKKKARTWETEPFHKGVQKRANPDGSTDYQAHIQVDGNREYSGVKSTLAEVLQWRQETEKRLKSTTPISQAPVE